MHLREATTGISGPRESPPLTSPYCVHIVAAYMLHRLAGVQGAKGRGEHVCTVRGGDPADSRSWFGIPSDVQQQQRVACLANTTEGLSQERWCSW
jgi:hypothetical protein